MVISQHVPGPTSPHDHNPVRGGLEAEARARNFRNYFDNRWCPHRCSGWMSFKPWIACAYLINRGKYREVQHSGQAKTPPAMYFCLNSPSSAHACLLQLISNRLDSPHSSFPAPAETLFLTDLPYGQGGLRRRGAISETLHVVQPTSVP